LAHGNQWVRFSPEAKQYTDISTIKIDASKSPKEIDLIRPDGIIEGIYKFDNNDLVLCLNVREEGRDRPQQFLAGGAGRKLLLFFTRPKEQDADSILSPKNGGVVPEVTGLPDFVPDRLKQLDDEGLSELERIYRTGLAMQEASGADAVRAHAAAVKWTRHDPYLGIADFDRWSGPASGEPLCKTFDIAGTRALEATRAEIAAAN
jgi:hypothetical protein